MPIYEYYCPACDSRFSHLARRYGAPPPPCPGCQSRQVEKLISGAHLGRSDSERRAEYDARAREVDREDAGEVARFLQETGSLAEEVAPVEGQLFREIVARRAEGAGDQDLQDVVDAVPLDQPAHDHESHAGHEHHEHKNSQDRSHDHGPSGKRSRRQAKDLGWA
jgi:putative FmdB family regulatory protein